MFETSVCALAKAIMICLSTVTVDGNSFVTKEVGDVFLPPSAEAKLNFRPQKMEMISSESRAGIIVQQHGTGQVGRIGIYNLTGREKTVQVITTWQTR